MTPLAQEITRQICLPPNKRTIVDPYGMLAHWDDVHCFECSAVYDIVQEIAFKINDGILPDINTTFLPAPKMFVERKVNNVIIGDFIVDDHVEQGVAMVWKAASLDSSVRCLPIGGIKIREGWTKEFDPGWSVAQHKHTDEQMFLAELIRCHGFLACINTPRVIGRRTHPPHAGLQRRLSRACGMVGKFPLHAWTEITLEVTPPEWADESVQEGFRSGGKMPLHFVRKHLRIRNGKLGWVRAHMRGDPAIRIKQSRYTVVPGKNAEMAFA